MPKQAAAPLHRVCQTIARESLRALPDRQLLDRFAAGDETAFAALLERHGPLVHGVCLRCLRDPHLTDDAFQATFVVLTRKARGLRRPEALAGWLFGVARRIAGQVRRRQQRLQRRETKAAEQRAEAIEPYPWDDLLQILDEELHRLPEQWRAPLVSCYLQGRTQDEAARELGWTLITLRRRLAAGRERLRGRMERRGATLSAGLIAAALAPAADAGVPSTLRDTTAALAGNVLQGGALPASVAELVRGSVPLAVIGRTKTWLVPLIAASVLVGVGALRPWLAAEAPAKAQAPPAAPTKPHVARDRFNDPLPDGAVARLGTIAFRHRGEIKGLAFSLDGKSLFSLGHGNVSEWQLPNGLELLHLGDNKDEYDRFEAVAPGARKLVIVTPPNAQVVGKPGEPATVCVVWDMTTRKIVNQFDFQIDAADKSGNSRRFYLSPDGKFLVVSDIGHLWLWDTDNGALRYHFRENDHLPTQLIFTPDGKRMISGDHEHALRVWDLASLTVKKFGGAGETVSHIAISTDGKRIAVAGGRNKIQGNTGWFEPSPTVRIWNLEKGEEITSVDTSKELGGVEHVALLPDGSVLAVGRKWGEIIFRVGHWQVPSGKKIRDWPMPVASVRSMAVSGDGKTLALGTHTGNIRLWDIATAKEIGPTESHRGMIWKLTFSGDGKRLTSAGDDEIREWDARTGQALSVFRSPLLSPEHGAATEDGRFVLKTHSDMKKHTLLLWDMTTKTHRDLGECVGALGGVALSPDGKRFALNLYSESGQSFQLRDSANGKTIWEAKLPQQLLGTPEFTPDGKTVVVNGKVLKGFDVMTGKELFSWDLHETGILPKEINANSSLVSSPDGKVVAFAAQMYGVVLVDAKTGKVLRRIETPNEVPWPVKFSPDGKSIATSNAWNDSVIRIWDVATGEKKREFTGTRNRIIEFAFSPNGRYLASGGYDGTVLIWDLATSALP